MRKRLEFIIKVVKILWKERAYEIKKKEAGVYIITTEAWIDEAKENAKKNRFIPRFGVPQWIKDLNRKHIKEIRKYWPEIDDSPYI